jgi:NTP pyrophosphatase (non-canonical NTP hydrolase)
MKPEYDDTLRAATKAWGAQFHHVMAIEECAELIQALTHFNRGRCTIEKVLEEIADVTILCRQLTVDNDAHDIVEQNIADKMQRLVSRVRENNFNKRDA